MTKYTCPYCGKGSTEEEWNLATQQDFCSSLDLKPKHRIRRMKDAKKDDLLTCPICSHLSSNEELDEHYINSDFCKSTCSSMNVTEADEKKRLKQGQVCPPHYCLKYDKILHHVKSKQFKHCEDILKCEECKATKLKEGLY